MPTRTMPPPARARTLGLLVCLACLLGAGCAPAPQIDADWHRRDLTQGLLAHWLAVAPTESGFMRTALDQQWQPRAQQPGHLTEQARLVYALAIGYELTQDTRYLAAARRGADFLLTRFRDPVHGGFFLRVAADGTVTSDAKNTYGHAFALLALSHLARVTGEPAYRAAALRTWQEVDGWLRDDKGGFRGELPRDFSQARSGTQGVNSQNPLMHLFEAVLALHEATQEPAVLQGAKRIADFVIYRLQTGTSDGGAFIPEWYDHAWKPLASREQGAYTDLGHQFEWIHLLLQAERQGLSGVYTQSAQRLLKYALTVGYDEVDGGVFTKVYPDGALDRSKYWWQQTEGLRALLAVDAASGQPDMRRRYAQTLGLVRAQFIDTQHGGWYARAASQCQDAGCNATQPDPYHMTGLHRAALLAAQPPR